jgi:hypothetical protein
MKAGLLRALKIVIAADSDPVRQVLFANLMQARVSVRLAYGLHARLAGTRASALLVSGYALGYFLRITPPTRRGVWVLGVAKHANARAQIDRVCRWLRPEDSDRVGTRFRVRGAATGLVAILAPAGFPDAVRSFRVVRRLDRRYGFLVACRAAAAVAWYIRGAGILRRYQPGAVLVSSDSNPEEVGVTAAAAALAIPRIFVSHAYPTPFAPALNFDLSILEGSAAVCARLRQGSVKGEIVLAGVEGESVPVDVSRLDRPAPRVGIFAPKATNWPAFAAVIDDCRAVFGARRVVIRWHPSRLDQARYLHLLTDRTGIDEAPMSATLLEVATQCDWVVADENSNVHLQVLKLGIPTVVAKGLGLYPESRADMYGFAAAGVVFPPVRSLRDLDLGALKAFFDAAWIERFRQYDASYLRSPAEMGVEVRAAIRRVIDGRREKQPA